MNQRRNPLMLTCSWKYWRINLNELQHSVKNHLLFKYSRRHHMKSLYPAPLFKQKEEHISMLSSDEVLDKYEHVKPFLFRWQLNEGPSELMRLHNWITHAMQQGIDTITSNVPKWGGLQWISLICMRCSVVTNSTSISSPFGPCKSISLNDNQIYSTPYVLLLPS
jgi:hypothetical protein